MMSKGRKRNINKIMRRKSKIITLKRSGIGGARRLKK